MAKLEKRTPSQDKVLFTIKQLCDEYNFSRNTVLKMIGDTPPSGFRNNANVWRLSHVTSLDDVRPKYEPQKPDVEPEITDPDKMPPKMQLTYYQAQDAKNASELKQRKNMVESRQLIPAFEVEQVLAEAFKPIALLLDTLPDALERDGIIASSDAEALIAIVDSGREQLAETLAKLSPEVRDVNASGDWDG